MDSFSVQRQEAERGKNAVTVAKRAVRGRAGWRAAGRVAGRVAAAAQRSFAASCRDKSIFFLLLSATALMTLLVSPYHDLSAQHIVLFLVSRSIVCRLSVLVLAPASPGNVPESLFTWRGVLLVGCCADIYPPAASKSCPVREASLSLSCLRPAGKWR